MKIKLAKIINSFLFIGLISAAVLFFLNFNYFKAYLSVGVPAGFDAPAHAEVGEYYAKNIFPYVWGWTNKWYAGMPFPQFYPPLFYFLTALLSKIFFFWPYAAIFKFFLLFLTFIVPGIISWITKKYSGSVWAAWVAALGSVFLLSTFYERYGNLGVTLQGTFNTGLVTQILGFVFFLLWVGFFLDAENSKKSKYLSIFFLTAVILSSVHIVPAALIVFAAAFIVNCFKNFPNFRSLKSRRFLKWIIFYFLLGVLPFALSAFWFLPMLSNFNFMAGRSLGLGPGDPVNNPTTLFLSWIFIFVAVLGSLYESFRRKNWPVFIIGISSLAVALPIVLKFQDYIERFPLHIYRAIPCAYFLGMIPVGYMVFVIFESLNRQTVKIFTAGLMLSVFATIWVFGFKYASLSSFNPDYKKDNPEAIDEYLKDKSGLINVEAGGDGRVIEYGLALSAPNIRSTYTALAESSINSMFMIALRNSFSNGQDNMPVDSFIGSNRNFTKRGVQKSAPFARFMGLKYILAKSKNIVGQATSSKDLALEKDFGNWKLFSFKEESSPVEIMKYEPVLLFADPNFKKRSVTDYDYVRFQEGLFYRNQFDYVFASPPDSNLDESVDLDNFKIAVVTSYDYKNIDKAYERLSAYSDSKPLILVSADDPLFFKLKTLVEGNKNKHIYVFENEGEIQNINLAKTGVDKILNFLDTIKIPIEADFEKISISSDFSDQKIKISISGNASTSLPVLIKSSFFPTWQRKDGGGIYLATPAYIFTFADKSFELDFTTPGSVYFGYAISALTFFAIIWLAILDFKKQTVLNS